jgi:hypothetical protein
MLTQQFVHQVLTMVFMSIPIVRHIFLLQPIQTELIQSVAGPRYVHRHGRFELDDSPYFDPVFSRPGNSNTVLRWFRLSHDRLVPPFNVRRALVEDCDDLLKLLREQNASPFMLVF